MTLKLKVFGSLLLLGLSGCTGLYGHDEIDRYFQRSDKMTLSAGEAKEVNAASEVLHPWPPGVGDKRIVSDGSRAAAAVDRYRRGAQPRDPLPRVRQGSPPPLGAQSTGSGGEGAPQTGATETATE
jgi:hypothetical protein